MTNSSSYRKLLKAEWEKQIKERKLKDKLDKLFQWNQFILSSRWQNINFKL